jgi:tRNA(Ile)-lysidine synthase
VTKLVERVEETIRARRLFAQGERILVAVSGGLDSVVLLRLLHALAPKHRWRLVVAHFNHRLRGRASEADERFVRALATELQLPLVTGRADVRTRARRRGWSVEMAAREMRHAFLARAARRWRCRVIALAHQADDQVELFFLRLLRGTGVEGLSGMKWRSPSPAAPPLRLVRPLLEVGRRDLAEYARAQQIRFREDASNASPDMLRNRIRHELLPRLRRRFQPALNQTVLRTMAIAAAEAEAVAAALREWRKHRRGPWSKWPVAWQRRLLQAQLRQAGVPGDFQLIETLRRYPAKSVTVRPGLTVQRQPSGRLHFLTAPASGFDAKTQTLALKGRAGQGTFDGVRLRWQITKRGLITGPAGRPGREFFDADRVGSKVVIRHWQPGDRFQPIGMPGPLKLQDWFTNRKVARARRHELVLATTARGEIFWVEDQRIDERFKLTSRTKRRLIWRWTRS